MLSTNEGTMKRIAEIPQLRIGRRSLLSWLAASSIPVWADAFPDKPITFVNPYPPGSAADITGRQTSNELAKQVKQSIVTVNRAGAGGIIGTRFVASAPPDGYTVLVGSMSSHVFNPIINKQANYDPIKDFVPISRTVSFPNVLVVPASLNVSSLRELIDLAKSRGREKPLTYGTAGNGTTSHISAAQFERMAGIRCIGVNFQGANVAMTEVLAGRIDFVFANINIALQHVRAGTLKPLAMAADERNDQMPNTPTFPELGMPEMAMSNWIGLFLPAHTPASIALFLNDALRAVAKTNVLQPAFEAVGARLEVDASPEAFGRLIQADIAKWTPIMKSLNITVQ
jgi:tripartite-type tricarboxylate transporter receptor subunit TctC